MTDILLDAKEVKALLANALRKELTDPGYKSPVPDIVHAVVKEYEPALTETMRLVLSEITSDAEFHDILRQEAKHKLAKQLVAEITSTMGKAVQSFRNHPTMKADMVKAIESIISEHDAKP